MALRLFAACVAQLTKQAVYLVTHVTGTIVYEFANAFENALDLKDDNHTLYDVNGCQNEEEHHTGPLSFLVSWLHVMSQQWQVTHFNKHFAGCAPIPKCAANEF